MTFCTKKKKIKNDKKGLGYSKEYPSSKSKYTILVRALKDKDYGSSSKVLNSSKVSSPRTTKSSKRWVCHFYRKPGHIRPFCFKLHEFSKKASQRRVSINKKGNPLPCSTLTKKMWKVKEPNKQITCNVAFTSCIPQNLKTGISIVVALDK